MAPPAPAEKADERRPLRLQDRLALRPAELAEVLGVSERLIRGQLRTIPHTRIGSALVFPVDAIRDWLVAQCTTETSRVEAIVEAARAKMRAQEK